MYKSIVIKFLLLMMTLFTISMLPINNTPVFADVSTGTFKVLTYNVAGLPNIISSSDPALNTIKISPKLNDYDFVAVQEDFAYHNDLISKVTHPYLTSHSGNVPFGDGLNFISKVPFNDVKRVTWKDRYGYIDNGSDKLTPKGFMYCQAILEPGVYVDIYTLHTDAGSSEGDYSARRNNIIQIANYIKEHSQGHAVIVLGDTNSRYTRCQDNFETALLEECNLSDPWIELVRGGNVPIDGEPLIDVSDLNGPNFEVVDKIFYRSSPAVTLTPVMYRLEDTYFVDENGTQLSDHYPVSVIFEYKSNREIIMTDLWGGSGGTAFNCLRSTAPLTSRPVSLTLRVGNRVDAISVTYSDGTVLSNGGEGGIEKTLFFDNDEYIIEVHLYKDKYNDEDRIFYAEFKTNKGNILSGGSKSGKLKTLVTPEGYYVAGFFGRAGANIDKLGLICCPLSILQ